MREQHSWCCHTSLDVGVSLGELTWRQRGQRTMRQVPSGAMPLCSLPKSNRETARARERKTIMSQLPLSKRQSRGTCSESVSDVLLSGRLLISRVRSLLSSSPSNKRIIKVAIGLLSGCKVWITSLQAFEASELLSDFGDLELPPSKGR